VTMVSTRKTQRKTIPAETQQNVKRRKETMSIDDRKEQQEVVVSTAATTPDTDFTRTKGNGNQGVREVTVGSAPSFSQCTMNDSADFGSRVISLQEGDNEDNAVENRFVNNCVMKQMLEHLQGTWYGWRKFVLNDNIARMIMKDTYHKKKSMMPVTGYRSEEMFIAKYTPAIKTAMSQLRRNSQTLARRNYMGKYQFVSTAFCHL